MKKLVPLLLSLFLAGCGDPNYVQSLPAKSCVFPVMTSVYK